MNKAMFYSLMESGSLLRDYSKCLEGFGYDEDPKGNYTNIKDKKTYSLNKRADTPEESKAWSDINAKHNEKHFKGKDQAAIDAEKAADKAETLSKATKRKAGRYPGMSADEIKAEIKYQRGAAPTGHIWHRNHPLMKGARSVIGAVGSGADRFGKTVGGTLSNLSHGFKQGGVVNTLLKHGVTAVPAFLAGSTYAAHKINQHPSIKAAKQWGPWLDKAKKYGPYAAAGGVGLLAAHALSNNDR